MLRSRILAAVALALISPFFFVVAAERGAVDSATLAKFTAKDWPWWRGPTRNGVAAPDQNPPVEFSETQNLLWKTSVPGRGHGSPTVVGSKVFLATADPDQQVQSVLCFDRQTGQSLWKKDVHTGNFVKGGNAKSSQASSTPACDGERVFINFVNQDAIYTTALDVNGKQLWQTKISDYVLHQGFGSSPAVYGPLVIVMGDNKGGGALVGLDRVTGKTVWRHERPKLPNYPSPMILNIGGRDQVLMTGCNLVTSLDPLTGDKIWETEGSTTECVTSTVTDGRLVFTTGGYPKNHISAVVADGTGKIEWENKTRVYVPSLLVRDGYLYGVTDAGVAMCRECATGADLWSSRLGGTFTASPVLVGDKIYAFGDTGMAIVFKATPTAFEKIAESKLGDEIYSTPAICGGQIFLRAASQVDGKRQEFLYCLERKN